MKELAEIVPAEPFFLKAHLGERFCLFYSPHPDRKCRGSILYIHPFGEEMNKSRRMAALQARAFSDIGFAVLQIDLFGCGDSSGQFCEARWNIWKEDLAIALNWMKNRITGPVTLWGLRLGALLALDYAMNEAEAINRIILWQPVTNGESFLNQFLRLQMANEMLANPDSGKVGSTKMMRQKLTNGEMLEVAGYELAPALAAAIDRLRAAELLVRKSNINWFEIVSESGLNLSPAAVKVIAEWKREGVNPQLHLVSCPPFWASQEILECYPLITATKNVCAMEA